MEPLKDVRVRNGGPPDHEQVLAVMPQWWGGRDLTAMLPKVFFVHFHNTVYVAELNGAVVGFLVGFFSQSDESVGYIHFVGVHPDFRKAGIGRRLYKKFFEACRENGRFVVKSCTSPINRLSIDFHLRMGFAIEPGDGVVDGVAVTLNYLGKDQPKVLFKRALISGVSSPGKV